MQCEGIDSNGRCDVGARGEPKDDVRLYLIGGGLAVVQTYLCELHKSDLEELHPQWRLREAEAIEV